MRKIIVMAGLVMSLAVPASAAELYRGTPSSNPEYRATCIQTCERARQSFEQFCKVNQSRDAYEFRLCMASVAKNFDACMKRCDK